MWIRYRSPWKLRGLSGVSPGCLRHLTFSVVVHTFVQRLSVIALPEMQHALGYLGSQICSSCFTIIWLNPSGARHQHLAAINTPYRARDGARQIARQQRKA